MPRRIDILKSLITDTIYEVKKDFGPNLQYRPYRPKVLGNKLSSHNKYYK